jgi:hypothetical protein
MAPLHYGDVGRQAQSTEAAFSVVWRLTPEGRAKSHASFALSDFALVRGDRFKILPPVLIFSE